MYSQHRNLRQCILLSCAITGNEITRKWNEWITK